MVRRIAETVMLLSVAVVPQRLLWVCVFAPLRASGSDLAVRSQDCSARMVGSLPFTKSANLGLFECCSLPVCHPARY